MSVQGDFSIQEYAAWLSELGEGSLNDEDDNVILPEMLLCSSNDIGSLIDHAYPSIHTAHSDHYFQERCILAPFDREVEEINTIALKRFPGPLRDSSWSVDQALDPQMEESAPFEVLHGITPPGFPLGQLSLKVGCPVILLRDLPGGKGTRNGSRGIVTDIAVRVLQLRMLSGEVVLVPRVPHTSAELRRLQFPVALAFAMTIEKKGTRTIVFHRRRRLADSLFPSRSAAPRSVQSKQSRGNQMHRGLGRGRRR